MEKVFISASNIDSFIEHLNKRNLPYSIQEASAGCWFYLYDTETSVRNDAGEPSKTNWYSVSGIEPAIPIDDRYRPTYEELSAEYLNRWYPNLRPTRGKSSRDYFPAMFKPHIENSEKHDCENQKIPITVEGTKNDWCTCDTDLPLTEEEQPMKEKKEPPKKRGPKIKGRTEDAHTRMTVLEKAEFDRVAAEYSLKPGKLMRICLLQAARLMKALADDGVDIKDLVD